MTDLILIYNILYNFIYTKQIFNVNFFLKLKDFKQDLLLAHFILSNIIIIKKSNRNFKKMF